MATAALYSVDVKNAGVTMVIPDDDVARVMYYLHCVTVGVGLDILVDDLVDFQNYRRLAPHRVALVFKYALEFSPEVFLNKLIFLDDEGEVVTGTSRNKFVTVSTACDIVHVERNIAISGQVKDITTVMFFKSAWLEHFYTFPITRQVLGSRHCAHCDGKSGVCACNSGCNTMPESQCEPLLNMLVGVLSNTSISSPQTAPTTSRPAPTLSPRAHMSTCDGCGWKHYETARYRCEDCEDYDLCQDCYSDKRHNPSHRFLQIERPGAKPYRLPARSPRSGAPPAPISRAPSMNPEAVPVKSANSHACNCDGCGWQFIDGARFKCEVCEDFDLCKDCYNAKRHSAAHRFMQIDRPGATAIHLAPRNTLTTPISPTQQPRARSPVPPPPARPAAPVNRTPAAPPPTRPSAAAPPPANPPSYVSAISHTASSPAFYNSMKVSELKEYLRDNGVAHEDVLDKETLCRRAWETHVDSMSIGELNIYLSENHISTQDCRDIASRREKAKQAFQSTRHSAPEPSERKTDTSGTSPLQNNDIVVLTGLSREDMNGKQATVLQADCGNGRAEVHVEELGRAFKVKFENLILNPFVDQTGDGHDEDFLD
ncbi:hypothetical protein CVT26_014913 [Gymnopilus dilepis]|uniref:ZZ-type domain-containing protein n=1 Tax=Gymnopilus dilepis TaxID=231916 RepID=A0A409XWW5_9AGAR|nr:hypothetical protein CVT26_014913 [Gymnopilus dilepis]